MHQGQLALIYAQINFHKGQDYEVDHYDLYDVRFF